MLRADLNPPFLADLLMFGKSRARGSKSKREEDLPGDRALMIGLHGQRPIVYFDGLVRFSLMRHALRQEWSVLPTDRGSLRTARWQFSNASDSLPKLFSSRACPSNAASSSGAMARALRVVLERGVDIAGLRENAARDWPARLRKLQA